MGRRALYFKAAAATIMLAALALVMIW